MATIAIPDDFPGGASTGAVPGAQPKLLLRKEGDRYVLDVPDDSEVQERYEICEDMVQQLVRYSSRKQAEHPEWTPTQVREKVAEGVSRKAFGWGMSPAETEWIIRRLAAAEGSSPAAVGPTL